MSSGRSAVPPWRRQLHGVYVIAKKDAVLYYFQPPVLIHGMLLPAFFFLAFVVARGFDAATAVPAMVAMTMCFTASAVSPMVTPWERRSKTYERLISSPVSQLGIVLGDTVAGAVFGIALSVVALVLGLVFSDVHVPRPGMLAVTLFLSGLSFGSLGVLLSARPTRNPSQVMMLANVVRMPMIFISGVLVPLAEMPRWSRLLAVISPLSYCSDLIRMSFGAEPYFGPWLDVAALVSFSLVFLYIAYFFHRRGRARAL